MWSDNVTSVDLLGFEYLSKAARRLILNAALHPTTIGVFGLWGSGKSCLAGMLRKSLENEPGVLCIEFNAWTYEGFEDAKSALMGTILERLLEEKKLPAKTKGLFLKLLHAVDVRRLIKLASKVGAPVAMAAAASPDPAMAGPAMAAAATVAASTITVEEVAGVLKPAENAESPRKDMREFRDDFEKLLKEADLSTLVVFIDDLDRCLPDTVVEVLEAIRLFLSTPKTVFVVCADERLVRSAVRRRFPQQPGDDFDVANEYLEKLVQHPLRIHALGAVDVRLYLALLLVQGQLGDRFPDALKQVTSRADLEAMSTRQLVEKLMPDGGTEREDIIALVGQIADVLGVHLNGNPRQLKRFMNTLVLRMGMAEDRSFTIQRRVLAKLMVLEYARLPFFRQLSEWQAAESGKPGQLASMEASVEGEKTTRPKKAKATDGEDSKAAVDPNIALWTNDPWLSAWLKSEPSLAGVDLRPYFLLARDRLGLSGAGMESLSPAAAAVLDMLAAPARLVRAKGPKAAVSLTPLEAASVLRALADQCRRAQSLAGEGSPLEAVVELVKVRSELAAETMLLLEELSVNILSAGTPPLIAALGREVTAMAPGIERLLRKWSEQQANPKLAETAKITLTRGSS